MSRYKPIDRDEYTRIKETKRRTPSFDIETIARIYDRSYTTVRRVLKSKNYKQFKLEREVVTDSKKYVENIMDYEALPSEKKFTLFRWLRK